MTAADGLVSHDVSPEFVWKPEYHDQLRTIVETDDIPDSLDWPALRESIKYQIRQIVQAFPDNPSPYLHPAARAQPAPAGQAGPSGSNPYAVGSSSVNDERSSGRRAAEGLEQRFASTSALPANGTVSHPSASTSRRRHDGSESEEDNEDKEESEVGGDIQWTSQDVSLTGTSLMVADADRSGFYPAKTHPSSQGKTSWGRCLTAEETEAETLMILSMLDDFDVSPPFTIQRLAELVLEPKRFVRSAPKYLSSLARVLGITASHRDFPTVSPGIAPGSLCTTVGNALVGEAEDLQRITGPPSPTATPIFSPIPFLMKSELDGRGRSSSADVPELSLEDSGGPSSVLGDTSSTASDTSTPTVDEKDRTGHVDHSGSDVQAPPPVTLEGLAGSPAPRVSSPILSITASTSNPLGAPSGVLSNSTQLLRVPRGRVDEFDTYQNQAEGGERSSATGGSTETQAEESHRMDVTMHPLSSTTTAAPSNDPAGQGKAAMSGAMCIAPSGAMKQGDQGDEEQDIEGDVRQIKRMKSDVTTESGTT